MIVFLNGEFVPEDRAVVSVFDRSFLYGDGLFEAVRIHRGKPFRWEQHLARLQQGADFLGIPRLFSRNELRESVEELVRRNGLHEALLRLTLSRGVGPRGYSAKGAGPPFLAMSLHPLPPRSPSSPPQWRVVVASFQTAAGDPVANFKTNNKLHQILARTEAEDRGANEALLLNTDGQVAEGASSNVFWIEDETVCTPPIASGILTGVTRAVVLELCQREQIPWREKNLDRAALQMVQGLFLTVTTLGVIEVSTLDGRPVAPSPMVSRLRQKYDALLDTESV